MIESSWSGGKGGKKDVQAIKSASTNISGVTFNFLINSDLMTPENAFFSQSDDDGGEITASWMS